MDSICLPIMGDYPAIVWTDYGYHFFGRESANGRYYRERDGQLTDKKPHLPDNDQTWTLDSSDEEGGEILSIW